jgi:hypothetical protein
MGSTLVPLTLNLPFLFNLEPLNLEPLNLERTFFHTTNTTTGPRKVSNTLEMA